MLLLVSVVLLVVAFILLKSVKQMDFRICLGAGVMAGYLLLYLVVPPIASLKISQIGRLYEFLPTLAFVGVLFPELNPKLPNSVTQYLSIFLIVFIALALGIFKFFVWS